MNRRIEERMENLYQYFTSEKAATVRTAAKAFGISKSTVHKDMTERLKDYSYEKYKVIQKILQKNKSERHIRGGQATRLKYKNQ